MKTFVLLVASVLVFASGAQAATAAFQGNCSYSGSNVACSFDSARPASNPTSCPGSSVFSYCWDFGDGNVLCPTSQSAPMHTYTAPLSSIYTVKLTVTCNDGTIVSDTNNVCVSIGVPGCILINGTWAGQ